MSHDNECPCMRCTGERLGQHIKAQEKKRPAPGVAVPTPAAPALETLISLCDQAIKETPKAPVIGAVYAKELLEQAGSPAPPDPSPEAVFDQAVEFAVAHSEEIWTAEFRAGIGAIRNRFRIAMAEFSRLSKPQAPDPVKILALASQLIHFPGLHPAAVARANEIIELCVNPATPKETEPPARPRVSLRPGGQHQPTCPYSNREAAKGNGFADCNCMEDYFPAKPPPLQDPLEGPADEWTYFLTSFPPLGQKRSTNCDYCHHDLKEHDARDNRCPIPNCTIYGPPAAKPSNPLPKGIPGGEA